MGFHSEPSFLLFDRAYNWTCQWQFNMMHLFTNSSSGVINHLADPSDAPPHPYLTVGVFVRERRRRRRCVWVSVLRCRFCLSLTPAVLVVRVCYLSRRWSWLLADIWNSAEVSRCEFWINTGKAPCPLLTFAWAGRVRRPNAVLLQRYY